MDPAKDEYPSLNSRALRKDLEEGLRLLKRLESKTRRLRSAKDKLSGAFIRRAQEAARLRERSEVLLSNVWLYAFIAAYEDTTDEKATAVQAEVLEAFGRLEEAASPLDRLLTLAGKKDVARFLAPASMRPFAHKVAQLRKARHELLPLDEERLIAALSTDGHHAWTALYHRVEAELVYELRQGGRLRKVGVKDIARLASHKDYAARRRAIEATNTAWRRHEGTCAEALSAITGWRLTLCRKKSRTRPVHFLDQTLRQTGLSRKTLETMMDAVRGFRPRSRRALKLFGRLLGHKGLDILDYGAPVPSAKDSWKKFSLKDAVELVRQGYADIHPEMGAFMTMLKERGWIEAGTGPHRRHSTNYGGRYPKSGAVRVLVACKGHPGDVNSIAHEAGHAFHFHVMRDIPRAESQVPNALAETASNFGEIAVKDHLYRSARTPALRLAVAYMDMMNVRMDLMLEPAKFDLEKAFHEQRAAGPLSPAGLKDLERRVFDDWYGDILGPKEEMCWPRNFLYYGYNAAGFSNYIYTFGFLFALGIHARRRELGKDFYPRYAALLRDTGRMGAEDLAKKHLGEDLSAPSFWNKSLRLAAERIGRFERAVKETGSA